MRIFLLIGAMFAAAHVAAAENQVAKLGLKDGWYCKAGATGMSEDQILVDARGSPPFIGIDGLDCHDPVVSDGRLTAKTCYSNGGHKSRVSKSYAASGDKMVLDGVEYILTPQSKGEDVCARAPKASATIPKVPAAVPDPSPTDMADSGWSTWFHNGSTMLIHEKAGRIVYEEPKASIAATVPKGTLLFEGTFDRKNVRGTAYVFKRGCLPAPYNVSGRIENKTGLGSRLVLTGAAPKRDPNSCMIVGETTRSPNARLVFDEYGDL